VFRLSFGKMKRIVILAWLLSSSACAGLTSAPVPLPVPPARVTFPPPSAAPRVYRFDPASHPRFERVSIEQGLSQSTVQAIVQDRRGFLWFGTEDGLNRYDGYGFKVYKHSPDDPASLAGNSITALYEDSLGTLWVGTETNGLERFDRETEQFAHHRHSPVYSAGLSHDTIRVLYEDSRGVLWIGTEGGLSCVELKQQQWSSFRAAANAPAAIQRGVIFSIYESKSGVLWFGTNGGLIRYDRSANTFTAFRNDPNDPTSLSYDGVAAIAEDAAGALWVGTWGGGVNILAADDRRFARVQSKREDPTTISSNNIIAIHPDRSGAVWVATSDRGVNRFDPARNRFVRYRRAADDLTSLSSDSVRSIYEDKTGTLWIGTQGGGVNKLDRASQQFAHYRSLLGERNTLSNNMVLAVFAESKDVVWIGTEEGLNRLDRATGQFTHHKNDPQDATSLGHNTVRAIYKDREGTLWVGTDGGGLNRFDPARNRFVRYVREANNPASLSSNTVVALYEDASGGLWVGTAFGLDRFDRTTGTFTHYRSRADDPNTLSNNYVVGVYPDRSGMLWVATPGGLNKFDPTTGKVTRYLNNPDDANSVSGNFVLGIHQDHWGNVWIGTYTDGLNKLDPVTGMFTHYREKQGLPNDTVYAILEDEGGCLWMSTNKGIAKFDLRTEAFQNYDADDGLQSNEFNWGAYHAGAHGEMFFGGINGLTAFYPTEIRDDPATAPIVLTQLTQSGTAIALSQAVESTLEITLAWPQNYFEFEFAALDYARAQKNQSAYILEGFDRRWNEVGNQRAGRYTNLPGGTYTLRLIGSNGRGGWNETGASLKVTVVPPIWEAWWLRGLIGGLLAVGVWAGYQLRVRDIRARTRALEKRLDESTWALQQQTDESERQRQELQALYQADEELHHHLHLDDVLRALVSIAVERLKADKSAVLTWDKTQERLVMRVARGFSRPAMDALCFARGEMYAGHVLETGEPIVVSDTTRDPRAARQRAEITQTIQAEEIRSLMHLPIKVGDEVFGVFNVSYTQPRAFGAAEQQLFTALAQRAALAIESARHFDAERRRAEQFQIVAEIGRQVTALLDTNQIMEQVTQALQKVFNYYHVGIGLIEGDEVVYRVGAGALWDDSNFAFKPQRLQVGREGLTGWVAAHGEPLIVPDVGQDPRYVLMQGSATRSELVMPIIVKEQVIGVLDVQSDQLNAFDSTDLAVVQSIANQTGAAVENARLYERAQELAVMQERNRLARDLHDAVTQTLFSASLLADALPAAWESDPAEGRQLLKELRQLSRGALAEMRTLLLELRPAALVETKMGVLLRQLSEAAAGRAGLRVVVNVDGDCKLPAEAHIALYRIAQEALNNILKHSRATNVAVNLSCRAEDDRAIVELAVSDDGRGFDPAHVSSEHFGLRNMHERAQAIGAELNIVSLPGQGTRVQVVWKNQEDAR